MKAILRLMSLVNSGNSEGADLAVSVNGQLLSPEESLAMGRRVVEQIEQEAYERLTVRREDNKTRISYKDQDDYVILCLPN